MIENKAGDLSSFIKGLDEIDLDSSYYLLLVVGRLQAEKNRFLKRVEEKTGSFQEFDLRDVISQNEADSYSKIDDLFSYIGETEKNIIFRNGDCLAGEYTGFTYSSVRYATPQEKHLLKKIVGSERFFVIDLQERENIDKTLQRFAQAAAIFDEADAFFGKLLGRLKQITVHGHTFANKRPAIV